MNIGYPDLVDAADFSDDVDFAFDDAEQVEALRTMEPGPAAILVLRGLVTEHLDVDARIEVAAAWQRQLAWLNAQAQGALADVIDDVPDRSAADDAEREWRSDLVAASLGWSPRSTANRLVTARRLLSELPLTHGLLTAGEISFRHAWVLADEVSDLSSEEIAAVEARVVERAPKQTVAQFTRSVRRAIITVNPELAAARRAKAVRLRGVRRVAYADGMAGVIATLEAADAETVYQALDAAARKAAAAAKAAGEAELPIDARRGDALVTWANDALADPDVPRRQGRRVELQLVIDLATLLGMAENPAELIGYGPIPAAAARALAGEAGWRRLVTDPVDGHLLDYGTALYRPPRRLVDYLVARDRRCRFPGCEKQADACDIDHVCPAGKPDGKTAACNCCCLCRRHHRMKTHGGWSLELHGDGSVTWSAPSGRIFHVDPVGQLE